MSAPRLTLTIVALLAFTALAEAGIPRGVVLTADEQVGDDTTGITIARGNAELVIERQSIRGTADVIELHPASNEILLKGRAVLSVGREIYRSDTVSCTLDFSHCLAISPDQPLPEKPGVAAAITPR